MEQKNRWYVRRDEQLKGPFLASHISQYLLLGRILDDDELSQDQVDWHPASYYKHLYPAVLLEEPRDIEKIKAERIKIDERARDRRAGEAKDLHDERRKARERREEESEDFIEYRERHARVMDSLIENTAAKTNNRVFIYLGAVFVMLFILTLQLKPNPEIVAADCNATAAPGVNWKNCVKPGIDLSKQDLSNANLNNSKLHQANFLGAKLVNADLSYAELNKAIFANADLNGARLKGANLSGADLHYTNFENADLSYADLTGAEIGGVNLKNARLDNTIWIDKRICAAGSLGKCLAN